jgi:hypothetical protein
MDGPDLHAQLIKCGLVLEQALGKVYKWNLTTRVVGLCKACEGQLPASLFAITWNKQSRFLDQISSIAGVKI